MTRLMLDSTSAQDIPFSHHGENMDLVAGYVDGWYAWPDEDWNRFPPHVKRVRICIFPQRVDADVIDIEPGNFDAKGVVPWIKVKWERDEVPTVYCFSDGGPVGYRVSDVREACDKAGVKRPLIWITRFAPDYPITKDEFDPEADKEIIALQYDNSAETGGHFDASIVADFWPGIDKKEEPVASPVLNDPQFAGQSVAVVTLKPSEVGVLHAMFRWPNGQVRTITKKVYAERTGMRFYQVYPPADPDADVTEDLDAQPAMFLVVVSDLG